MDELPDLSSGIGKLLEDPEMLGKALTVATTLKNSGMLDGLFGGSAKNSQSEVPQEEQQAYSSPYKAYTEDRIPEERTALAPPPSPERGGWSEGSAQRRALLMALRPYMSKERQERIDTILRILELLDLASKLGGGKL